MTSLITAAEAARRLGVSRQTLYAYVSRGLIKAHQADDPRERRYLGQAVDRLVEARKRGRRPKDIAKATLDWGTPVLESAIATVEAGRLYYRGRDAVAFARAATLEEAAALLWQAPSAAAFPHRAPALPAARPPPARGDGLTDDLIARFAVATTDDATAAWLSRERILEGCGALIRVMAALVAGAGAPSVEPIHLLVARAFGCNASGAELIRMALVLSADHELNASSFAARVVASTGASLRAAAVAGLAALTGPRHGGMTSRVEGMFDSLGDGDPIQALRRRLAAGEDLAGFGHPLYPDGDPRAATILAETARHRPQALALAEAGESLTGHKPSLDFALVAARRALGLPRGAAFNLFALGRAVGWIAHGLEQRERKSLIRPRATYVGPPPGSG